MNCHHANFDQFGRCGLCGEMMPGGEPREPRPSEDLALLLVVLQHDHHMFAPALEKAIKKVRELESAMVTIANHLPDDARAIVVDLKTERTIGDLVGRRWNEPHVVTFVTSKA